jgi:NADH-quinone oxidoreductase subunit M
VLLKMGAYAFLRFSLPLFPLAAQDAFPLIVLLAVIGIIYGALVAYPQPDMKRLVAYSSVSHMGFIMLGLYAFNWIGITGGVLQMINHGLSTGALFILIGFIYDRRHTREIEAYGGIWGIVPIFSALFLVVVLSSVGLPGLNGFVGEFLILAGTFLVSPWIATAATFGVVLAAAYLLWAYRRVFFGPVEEPENRSLIDLDWRERFVVLAVLVPIIWIGVYPNPFLRRLDASVSDLLHQMEKKKVAALQHVPDAGPAAIAEVLR